MRLTKDCFFSVTGRLVFQFLLLDAISILQTVNNWSKFLASEERQRIEDENILMSCAFLGVDNFLSSLVLEIICLALWQVLHPLIPWLTLVRTGEGEGLPEGV